MTLELNKVSWIRNGNYILKDIDWRVQNGQHWAIVGLNGSGKTTLLNLINGYFWPSSGEINVFGEEFGNTDLREMRKLIGWVSSSLQEKLYVNDYAEDVVLSGKFASIGLYDNPETHDVEQAHILLEQMGCSSLIGRSIGTLSQGERQRIMIARALMNCPKLLILDEPSTGLDLFAREQLLETVDMVARRKDGPVLLFVTHYIEEILPVFTHTLLLRRGEVFATGATKEVITGESLSRFFESPVEVRWQNQRAWVTVRSGSSEEQAV